MKIVFLDIDGVLQPSYYQRRFKHDLDKLQAGLAQKYNDSGFLKLNKYDIGAVYYDWQLKAVENLKTLLNNTGAKIVLSSDWKRGRTLDELKRLFKIHDLDEFLIDTTPNMSNRCEEIEDYLASHSSIEEFVILDDYKFWGYEKFGEKFIYCDMFLEEELNQALKIFFK
ncbi:hypothetical protein JCM13304A_19730 [Desulfothermus okinawensis JCM 13304]